MIFFNKVKGGVKMNSKTFDNNKYGFIDRLEKLRSNLDLTKGELADYLNVDKSLVSLVYSNKRAITQNFYDKLAEKTGKDELYWRFGFEYSIEVMQNCENFNKTLQMIMKFKDALLNENTDKLMLEQIYQLIGTSATLDLQIQAAKEQNK